MTTLFNHKALGTKDKPLIPNIELKRLIEQIQAGNKDISYWADRWTLEESQARIINQLLCQNSGQ